MQRIRSLFRRTSAAEHGLTVVELTITMALLLLVVGSLLTIFQSVQRSAAYVQNRSQTLDEMRLAIDTMTKEVRQATWVDPTSTTSRLAMDTYILGVKRRIVYQVTGTKLTRSVEGGTGVPIQQRLASTAVFTYVNSVTNVQVVGLNLRVSPINRPNTVLVLTSEARLRNRGTVT